MSSEVRWPVVSLSSDIVAGLKSECQQGGFLLKAVRKPVSSILPASRGHLHSLAHSLFFHLQSQQRNVILFLHWLLPSLRGHLPALLHLPPPGDDSWVSHPQGSNLTLPANILALVKGRYFRQTDQGHLWVWRGEAGIILSSTVTEVECVFMQLAFKKFFQRGGTGL